MYDAHDVSFYLYVNCLSFGKLKNTSCTKWNAPYDKSIQVFPLKRTTMYANYNDYDRNR